MNRRARALQMLQKPTTSQVDAHVPSNPEPSENERTPLKISDTNTTEPPILPVERDNDEEVLESFERWDPMGEDFYSTENTIQIDPDKEPECVVTGHMTEEFTMVGKHKVCEFYLKHGTCADGEYCSRLHIDPGARDKLRTLGATNVMTVTKTCLFHLNLLPVELEPNPDALLLVSLTSFRAPNNFNFIAPYEQMNFAGFNDDEIRFYIGRVQHSSTFKTKLSKCQEQLALLFDHNYRVDNIKDHIFLDQIVAAKLDNGKFYRAAVIEKLEMDDYKLSLIDVGKEVTLSRTNIYSIRANCLNDPPLSIMASLRVKPPNGDLNWSKEALKLFEALKGSQSYILCRVLSLEMDDVYTVDLLNIETRSSLTNQLITSGLAEATFAS